jgi:nitrate reductase NapE component
MLVTEWHRLFTGNPSHVVYGDQKTASVQRAKMRTYQDKKLLSDIAFFGILTIALVCIAITGYGVIDWILRLLRI